MKIDQKLQRVTEKSSQKLTGMLVVSQTPISALQTCNIKTDLK